MTSKTGWSDPLPNRKCVWMVDDSERYCKAVVEGLEGNRYLKCERYFRSAQNLLNALGEESEPPSAILLDVEMPAMDGVEAISLILQKSPTTRIIMLTCHEEETYVRDALQQGASGYLLKPSSPLEIENAVRAALANLISLDTVPMKRLIPPRNGQTILSRLTSSEKRVYRLAAEGLSRKEIAKRLFISANTVHFHLQNIYSRLGFHHRSDIIKGVRPTIEASPASKAERE